ncbi:MAG: hypothetical protein OFPII_30390 [Osedax symbiont Rs1]|nr:MAG: hypothetical protein OFPII_30390 [Osedax symbiont Rs1]
MNSDTSPVTQGNIDDYKATCVDTSITPIFPVRYSFADFELLQTSLEYPSARQLIDATDTKKSGGMCVRMLRHGWVMIFDEDKKNWHPFEYNLDQQGNVEKFTKYIWLEGNASGKWEIERCRTASDADDAVNGSGEKKIYPYAFLPRATTNFSICFTPVKWSVKTFEILEANDSIRAEVMQKANAYKKDVGNYEMAPELAMPVIEDFHSKGRLIPPQMWNLSGTTLLPKEKRGQVVTMMAKCAERGVVVALHDPLGIAMDIGALCANFGLDKAAYVEHHKYAITTMTQVESLIEDTLTPIRYDANGETVSLLAKPRTTSGRAFDLYQEINQEKFHYYRNHFARDLAIIDGRLAKAVALWEDWMSKTDSGSVFIAMQQIDANHPDIYDMQLAFTAIEQMTFGLSTSKVGQRALYNQLLKTSATNADYLKLAREISGKALGWSKLHDTCQAAAANLEDASGERLSTLVKKAIDNTMIGMGTLISTQVAHDIRSKWLHLTSSLATFIHGVPLGTQTMSLANALSAFGLSTMSQAGHHLRGAMLSSASVMEALRFDSIHVEVITVNGTPLISMDADTLTSKLGAGLGLWGVMASSIELSSASRNAIEKQPGSKAAALVRSVPAQILLIGASAAEAIISILGQGDKLDHLLQRGGTRTITLLNSLYPAGLSHLASSSIVGSHVVSVGTKIASAGKTLLMKMLKLGTIMGVVEIVISAITAWEKFQRGDLDAAMGATMMLSGGLIFTLAGASSLVPGFGWAAAAVILLVGGILVMAFAEDDDLTVWVKNCFWGSNEFFSGSDYLYFGNKGRDDYSYYDKEGFDAFFEHAKKLGNDEKVKKYFKHEISVFHNLVYKPKITFEEKKLYQDGYDSYHLTIKAKLPGFVIGQSNLAGHLSAKINYLANLTWSSSLPANVEVQIDIEQGKIQLINSQSLKAPTRGMPEHLKSTLVQSLYRGNTKKYQHQVPISWIMQANGEFLGTILHSAKHFDGSISHFIQYVIDKKFTYTYQPTPEIKVPISYDDDNTKFNYGETIKF